MRCGCFRHLSLAITGWQIPIYGEPFLDVGKYAVSLNRLYATVLSEQGKKEEDSWLISITIACAKINRRNQCYFSHCSSIICSSECMASRRSCLWPYPVGKEGAPSCWPGASTWQTAKCWVISCISSKLKNALKQDLSARIKILVSHRLSLSPIFNGVSIQSSSFLSSFLRLN